MTNDEVNKQTKWCAWARRDCVIVGCTFISSDRESIQHSLAGSRALWPTRWMQHNILIGHIAHYAKQNGVVRTMTYEYSITSEQASWTQHIFDVLRITRNIYIASSRAISFTRFRYRSGNRWKGTRVVLKCILDAFQWCVRRSTVRHFKRVLRNVSGSTLQVPDQRSGYQILNALITRKNIHVESLTRTSRLLSPKFQCAQVNHVRFCSRVASVCKASLINHDILENPCFEFWLKHSLLQTKVL